MTTLRGYGGVFTCCVYIAPQLTGASGLRVRISPLLLCGSGLFVGNHLGRSSSTPS